MVCFSRIAGQFDSNYATEKQGLSTNYPGGVQVPIPTFSSLEPDRTAGDVLNFGSSDDTMGSRSEADLRAGQ